MLKRLAQSPVIPWLGGTLIWAYMRILGWTLRWRVEGLEHLREYWDEGRPFVLAAWHSRILIMPYLLIRSSPDWRKPARPLSLMVSASRDGEFSGRASRMLGLRIIRGSAARRDKTKTGKRSLPAAREAMEAMSRGGALVVTIDGPRGPAEVAGMGAVKLAQQMKAPIFVYGLSAQGKRLNTWDKLVLPAPFARGAVVIGEPIQTSKDMDSESLRSLVESRLKSMTARADQLAEASTVRPDPAAAQVDSEVGPPPREGGP